MFTQLKSLETKRDAIALLAEKQARIPVLENAAGAHKDRLHNATRA